jgi:hypothetical protein
MNFVSANKGIENRNRLAAGYLFSSRKISATISGL